MATPSWLDRLLLLAAEHHARRTLRRFLADAECAVETQHRVLRQKLARHAESRFGREHRFESISGPQSFAERLPIRTYGDYEPYIEDLRHGRFDSLLGRGQRVLMFALTSGTTRAPKYIPVTQEFLDEYRHGWNAWGLRALLDHPGSFLRHIVQVSSPMSDERTPAGVPAGAITGLMAATQKRLVRKYYTAPLAVAYIPDAEAKYYAIMRLSVPRDVAFLIAANPATLLLLAKTADLHRERLIRDIHDGTLSHEFDIPLEVRAALHDRLTAEPATARRLEGLVDQHGRLRPRDYWNLAFVAHWTGGTMGLYRSRFPEWYGDVPVRDPGLLASEGRMSVPVADNTAEGILDVTSHYFEFIPADEYESTQRRAVGIESVRVGAEYFLVLSTSSGLFRYDIGDRVRVTGFHGRAPLVEFLSKGAHTSSLAGEKLTEHQVVAAMRDVQSAGVVAADQFVVVPVWADPPRYRLLVEPRPDSQPIDADRLGRAFDTALAAINLEYAGRRSSQRLGPVEVRQTAPEELTLADSEQRRRNAGRSEQFKHRYLLTDVMPDRATAAGEGLSRPADSPLTVPSE